MVQKDILENGIRVVTETVPHVQSVSVGIWVNAGARNEENANRGISHFIEHMLFKGTVTRTAKQIADCFDSIGGQLNAFTEKEYTCYFAKVLSEHLPLAVDVLSDMFRNSIYDPQEIELEKNVVLEEIKRHEDTPEELVHDMLARTVWDGHPLGNSVLGTAESIAGLSREDILNFIGSRYAPDSLVIAAAGNLEHEALVDQVAGLFGNLEGNGGGGGCGAPVFLSESALTGRSTEQVHFCIAAEGYSHLDPRKYPLAVIDATLGGGMSSRLFQEIREKRGLAYAIGSYSSSYREGGLFTVYGGTSLQNIQRVVELTKSEFMDVRRNNITDEELAKAKNQIRGAIVLSQESMSSRMIRMGKSELYFGRVVPLEELISCIMKVTHDDVAQVSDEMFAGEVFPVVAVGPFDKELVLA